MTCPCHRIPKETKFCPDCGRKQPVKKVKMYRVEGFTIYTANQTKVMRAIASKEYRSPKKGEYYLSGCPGYVMAYKAPNDLSQKFRIAAVINIAEIK